MVTAPATRHSASISYRPVDEDNRRMVEALFLFLFFSWTRTTCTCALTARALHPNRVCTHGTRVHHPRHRHLPALVLPPTLHLLASRSTIRGRSRLPSSYSTTRRCHSMPQAIFALRSWFWFSRSVHTAPAPAPAAAATTAGITCHMSHVSRAERRAHRPVARCPACGVPPPP
jgi:hypothetical protein